MLTSGVMQYIEFPWVKTAPLKVQSCSKVEDHLLKIWNFTNSVENCFINFILLLLMLEEYCHKTDVSMKTLKNELFKDLVALEQK